MGSEIPDPPDSASIFLGPKAENADVLERLLLEALRDHVFWRRNFHPEDGFTIPERSRRTPQFEQSISRLSEELMGLLGELKNAVPFFSQRYIGHMSSDLTMASLVGYFAAMLYNPNNVSAEASPVTTRLELEVAAGLARMIGYAPQQHWGHLTSGGTVANFEALWTARNVKYLPVALRWAAESLEIPVRIRIPSGELAELDRLDLWRLLNVAPDAALDAVDAFLAASRDAGRARAVLARCSLTGAGFQEFGRRLVEEFGDGLPPGVVLVPSTAHYSWDKLCRALGIGASQLIHIPVDARFRMSPPELQETLARLARRRQAVIACVSVVGSTEESAVDRLDLIADLRAWAAWELGMAFTLHADAAWGGYAAAVTRGADGQRLDHSSADAWPDPEVHRALVALESTDSVTLDPHKLGFIPYPCGAICFRDQRVRSLLSVDAPYAFSEARPDRVDLGRFIFEGSRPGAAAAAAWLSHRVLPLHAGGYGGLIRQTAHGARKLHAAIAAADWNGFRLVQLPRPDINIVCFTFGHPSLRTLEGNNAFMGRVHRAMSAGCGRPPRELDYLVSQTTLRAGEYGHAALPLVQELGFSKDDYRRAGGLTILRCTVMDPFLADESSRVDFVGGFVATVARVLRQELGARG